MVACTPQSHGSVLDFITTIKNNTAVGGLDGAYKDDIGTAAYIIQDCLIDPAAWIVGTNRTPGRPLDVSSYRSECGELCGAFGTLAWLCKEYRIKSGGITLGCDCQSGMKTIYENTFVTHKQTGANLIQESQQVLHSLLIIVRPKYVNAHQDQLKAFHDLTLWEQMNVQMNSACKAYLQTVQTFNLLPFSLPYESG